MHDMHTWLILPSLWTPSHPSSIPAQNPHRPGLAEQRFGPRDALQLRQRRSSLDKATTSQCELSALGASVFRASRGVSAGRTTHTCTHHPGRCKRTCKMSSAALSKASFAVYRCDGFSRGGTSTCAFAEAWQTLHRILLVGLGANPVHRGATNS